MAIEPKDAEYPHVPTPKELELSQQLVELQHDKDRCEQKLIDQVTDLEAQVHTLHVRINDFSQSLQTTKREHIHHIQDAIETERRDWRDKLETLQRELDQEKHDKDAEAKWHRRFAAVENQQHDQQQHDAKASHNSTSSFATPPTQVQVAIDPTDDVFAKFAQSIALLPASAAGKVARAGALPFLTHLLGARLSDLVTGSVLLALVHLAIHEKPQRPPLRRAPTLVTAAAPVLSSTESSDATATVTINLKDEIVKAGAATPLLYILEHHATTNGSVVIEATRLCAALASHVPNKRVLAAKNAVQFLTELLTPQAATLHVEAGAVTTTLAQDKQNAASAHTDSLPLPGDHALQTVALSALVNLSYDSEILRSQIVNCGFLPTAVQFVRESTNATVQCEAAKLVGNLACNHVVNQSAIMSFEGDAALVSHLHAETLQQSPALVRACAIGIANLAQTSVHQLAIGYSDACTQLLQLAVDATTPSVLEAVLTALTSLCFQSPLNKSRVAAQNGLHVLLFVIAQSKRYNNDASVLVAACECFAVVARTRAHRTLVFDLDGHDVIIRKCKHATSAALLEATAAAVCALVPPPDERAVMVADSRDCKLETKRVGLGALERARHVLIQQRPAASAEASVPHWLTTAIELLTSYAAIASRTGSHSASVEMTTTGEMIVHGATGAESEWYERRYFCLESRTEIAPDACCLDFYEK